MCTYFSGIYILRELAAILGALIDNYANLTTFYNIIFPLNSNPCIFAYYNPPLDMSRKWSVLHLSTEIPDVSYAKLAHTVQPNRTL